MRGNMGGALGGFAKQAAVSLAKPKMSYLKTPDTPQDSDAPTYWGRVYDKAVPKGTVARGALDTLVKEGFKENKYQNE